MIDTTQLPDGEQRRAPIEPIGLVIGTCGTPALIHLQLAQARRFFGTSLPTLVVNDGDAERHGSEALAKICRGYPNVELRCRPYLGHSTGDLRVFVEGLAWADAQGIEILVKFSRRFIPLVSWRHRLQWLTASHPNAAAFTRRHNDRPDGLFRTDAIGLRVRNWRNARTTATLREALDHPPQRVMVEPLLLSLVHTLGGWVLWDLLGRDFYRPAEHAMQWRGLLHHHYGDLSRELGLPYRDADFLPSRQHFHDEALRSSKPAPGELERPRGAEHYRVLGPDPRVDDIDAEFARRVTDYSDINEHLPILRALAGECDHVTEFGQRAGNSTIALLAGRPRVLKSYDRALCPDVVLGLKRLADGTEFSAIEADTTDILPIERTDLLFIDTLHTYDQLRAELERHGGQVRRFLVIHDTESFGSESEDAERPGEGIRAGPPGLRQAIREWMEAHPHWRIRMDLDNNNGLMVLARGDTHDAVERDGCSGRQGAAGTADDGRTHGEPAGPDAGAGAAEGRDAAIGSDLPVGTN